MKNKPYDLTIRGFGYLQKVIEYDNADFVHIQCLPVASTGNNRDELVILNCVAKDENIKVKLRQYQCNAKNNNAVIVKFAAHYLETTACYNCQSPNDPERIIQITAQLTAISDVFVDGIKLSQQQNRPKVANG